MRHYSVIGLGLVLFLFGFVRSAGAQQEVENANEVLRKSLKTLNSKDGFSISHTTTISTNNAEVSLQGNGDIDASMDTVALELTNNPFGFKGKVFARNQQVVYRGGMNPDEKGWVKKTLRDRSLLLYKPSTILHIISGKDLTGELKKKEDENKLQFPVPVQQVQKYVDPVAGTHIVKDVLKNAAQVTGTKKTDDLKIDVEKAKATIRIRPSDHLPKNIIIALDLNIREEKDGDENSGTVASPHLEMNLSLRNVNHGKSIDLPTKVKNMLK